MFIDYEGRGYDLAIWSSTDLVAAGVPQDVIDPGARRLAQARIDAAAGQARARFVSPGALVAEEYRAARAAVERWRADGSPADDVPSEIVSGATYRDTTHEQAAVEIEQTAAAYEAGIAKIRAARLAGKRAVRDASGSDINAAAANAIAQLEAIQPPEPALGA